MWTAYGAEVCRASDMVASEEDTHATNADEDADNLGWMVSYMKEEKRNHHHQHNGPEVYQLGGEDGGVSVGEDGKVVSFYVKEGKDDIYQGVMEISQRSQ